MGELRTVAESHPDFPPLLFFYQEDEEQGARFFGEHWPEARAVSDDSHFFYQAFEVSQGGLTALFGLESLGSGLRALSSGHSMAAPTSNPWTMPAFFLVQGSYLLWSYRARSAGDHPTWEEVTKLARSLALPDGDVSGFLESGPQVPGEGEG